MKNVKLLFLLTVIIMMCTGCSVEYNINITEDNIEEIINITDNITENRTKTDILNHYNMWYPTFVNYVEDEESIELEDYSEKAENVKYHEKSINEINNGYKYTYKYNYYINRYNDAYSLATTYLETNVQNNEDTLVLKTDKENLLCEYDYFDSLKINITIDPNIYKLNYTNASNRNNNTYTWMFDRDDCNDSEIVLTLNKINKTNNGTTKPNTQDKDDEKDDKKTNKSGYGMYIFYGGLLLIVLFGYLIFKKYKETNDKFNSV